MIEDCETASPTELEELKTDAQRYRWLRNYRPGLILDMLEDDEITNEQWSLDLDQAIDLALARTGNKQEFELSDEDGK